MDIPISDRVMNGQPADDGSAHPFFRGKTKDESSSQKQDKSTQGPRFLGREYLAESRQQDRPAAVRKGMFLGRECIVDNSTPAEEKPKKQGKLRFMGREIL